MFARFIRMILLSMIVMVVASTVEARACDQMAAAAASSGRHEASLPEQGLVDVMYPNHAIQVTGSESPDDDGCLPRCCQGDFCCHLMALSLCADLWSARDEDVTAIVATDGTTRSTEPDVPPPKVI